jgi:hypothetical protein
MELHLKIIGVILLALGCIHIIFPNYFRWKEQMQSLSMVNRQMMYVHTFFIALTVFLMGVLCLYSTEDILHTRLGRHISLGFFIFWVTRLFFQFFYYSPRLWRGKLFETTIHIIFALLWAYLSGIFLLIFLSGK